jgi:NAD(P)-dependent dehydrogenase (short-subunit alcohol dehydrogenase family)
MSQPATGRVALVTGSSRGIGLAIAERLAAEGALVVMNGRRADSLRAAADRVRPVAASGVDRIVADVGDPDEVERMFRHILENYGRIDVLVNNAALANPVAHFLELDVDRWSEVIRSNLTSVFLCTRLAAHAMVEAHIEGAVINVSSFGALRAHRSLTAYDTAKGGIEAFTRAAALDLAPFGIRVNSVAPGPIRTDTTGGTDEDAARRGALVPLGRIGLPSDVADAVAFLASERARFITGQTLVVDGGALAQIRPPALDTPGLTPRDVEALPQLFDRRSQERRP